MYGLNSLFLSAHRLYRLSVPLLFLYDALLQVFQHLEVLGIGHLGIKLFAFGIESVVYATNFLFCFSIRYRAFTLQDVFLLKSEQVVNVLAPIVERQVSTPLHTFFCTGNEDINEAVQRIYLVVLEIVLGYDYITFAYDAVRPYS